MVRELPTGTVTFLFTDVEGSTKLLQRLGDAGYASALAEHRRVLRAAFEAHGGVEVDTQGDAFFIAFPTAVGALSAARSGLEALEPGPIRVRVGIHTGTPVVSDEGYVGEDVHRAARIGAAGHGGQVLVSATSATLVDVEAFRLRDLGEHRFKDLARPERVYQMGDGDFPRIRSLSPSNLPVPTTPFLGRDQELTHVGELLAEPSLRALTLTGAGGIGKTRLAIQAAAESSERFPGGLWWVALAPLKNPGLVLSEVAGSLGAEEQPGVSLVDTIAERIGGAPTLIVLDNAEHLLPALADEIAPLTRAGGGAKLLVTSRERLHLEAEREFAVPPMSSPDAEAFFRARAETVGVPVEPSPALDDLCERLDRSPLAMQLAAARLKLFSVDQLLERLSERLDLPGARDADPRQRTLRATIAWSHDLLDRDEQALFRHLAVFSGGGTVEAIERVCEANLDVLLSLVDKSLVRRRDDAPEPRFWMLETIRAFAWEQLLEHGEVEALREALARWCLAAVQRWDEEIHLARDRRPWLDRLDPELDNGRAALTWAEERGDDRTLQGIAGGLRMYWHLRGLYREGRRWLELARGTSGGEPALLVPVLDGLASLAYRQGDYELASTIGEEALPLARAMAKPGEILAALTNLANAYTGVDRLQDAISLYDEALTIGRESGDPLQLTVGLVNRGDVALIAGHYEEARTFLREGLELAGEHGVEADVALINLATICYHLGRDEEAAGYVDRIMESFPGISDVDAIALIVLAGVRVRSGDHVGAGRFLGASEALRDASGYQLEPTEQTLASKVIEEMGDRFSLPEVRAARETARALAPEDAKAVLSET